MAARFKLKHELSVVRVAPSDTLRLRERPGSHEPEVGALAHDTRGVRALGRVCRVGTATWLEVASGSAKGFANASFLLPATAPADETARLAQLLGSARFASSQALVDALRAALARQHTAAEGEPPVEVSLIGMREVPGEALAVLHACCFGDDSVIGNQIWLEIREQQGQWSLQSGRKSQLCPRGASGRLCI